MEKIKLFLKTKEGIVQYCWIEFNKDKKRVIGWHIPKGYGIANSPKIPEGSKLEVHFNYPEDGSFHYAYKRQNKSGVEEYISIYRDKIKIKHIKRGKSPRIIEKSTEELRLYLESLGFMIPPSRKTNSIEKLEVFQFPSIGFNITEGTFGSGKNHIYSKEVSANDILVDVSNVDNGSFSIFSHIRNKNRELIGFKEIGGDGAIRYEKTIEISDSHIIELQCYLKENI